MGPSLSLLPLSSLLFSRSRERPLWKLRGRRCAYKRVCQSNEPQSYLASSLDSTREKGRAYGFPVRRRRLF